MAEYKTPGVYIVEQDAFPNSVVEVPTAVPAFIGYTQKAEYGGKDLTGKPQRISSYAEFLAFFGGAPEPHFNFKLEKGKPHLSLIQRGSFRLHDGLRLFFDNGGGACWIVSIGGYGAWDNPTAMSTEPFVEALKLLEEEPEPTMIVTPDTVLLGSKDHGKVAEAALAHCAKMQSRMAILDVHDGYRARTGDDDDVIDGFRNQIGIQGLNYGAAYYPWLNTTIRSAKEVSYLRIVEEDRADLIAWLKERAKETYAPNPVPPGLLQTIEDMDKNHIDPNRPKEIHTILLAAIAAYKELMSELLEQMNLQPPAAAMAGVWSRTDNTVGVWKAPANTGMVSVASPSVIISSEEQEDLNSPLNGMAVNAIRTFVGRGVLIWGARTLDANSLDWRYINVRRTMIMLEQSIKAATLPYVFAPNDSGTWLIVQSMIENFLTNQWKAGALAGTKPADAFDVQVGLGSTMTGRDILDGYMRVTVKVAVVRPAEFVVITFQQQMQKG